jgi:hypothetical protein
VLWFDADSLSAAWDAIAAFEPGAQYEYDLVAVDVEGRRVTANTLVGRDLGQGTAPDPVQRWSAALDPVFAEGLTEVLTMALETAPCGLPGQPDDLEFWKRYFRLQATYLLLWSIVERYTALRFGPALPPSKRISRLNADPDFKAAVREAGAVPHVVYDARDPSKKHTLRADGTDAASYFYQVRCNLSHRGKSAYRDGQLVLKALVELHDSMRILLRRQVHRLDQRWEALRDNGGWLLRRRLAEHPSHPWLRDSDREGRATRGLRTRVSTRSYQNGTALRIARVSFAVRAGGVVPPRAAAKSVYPALDNVDERVHAVPCGPR